MLLVILVILIMSLFDDNIKSYPYEGLEELYEKYDYEKFSMDPLYCIHCLYEIVSGGHQPSDFLYDSVYVGTEKQRIKQEHSEYLHITWTKFEKIKQLFEYPKDYEIRMALFTKTVKLTDEQMKEIGSDLRYILLSYVDFEYVHV